MSLVKGIKYEACQAFIAFLATSLVNNNDNNNNNSLYFQRVTQYANVRFYDLHFQSKPLMN